MKNRYVSKFIQMGKLWAILVMACAIPRVVYAQQRPISIPQYEVSGLYSFVRANGGNSDGSFNLNGGSGSFAYSLTDRFSIVADFGAYRFSGLPTGLDSTMYTYLFGPRMTLHKTHGFTPFAHILAGGGRLNASSAGIDAGENGFALAVGGGADIGFHAHWVIRVIQADYLMTRFAHIDGSSATQNNVRLSAGIVFRFGGR